MPVSLEIKKWPDSCLTQPCLSVPRSLIGTDEKQHLIDIMMARVYRSMYTMGGLAANQLGATDKVAIFNLGTRLQEIINPEYVYLSRETIIWFEGCCSFPFLLRMPVRRSKEVVVKGLNGAGSELMLPLSGKFAVAAQHEIDHLNGILMIDKQLGKRKEE